MKKLLAILLSLVMVMCLFAACDSDDDDGDSEGGKSSSSYEDPVVRAMKIITCKITKSETKEMFPDEYWEVNDFDEYWENTEAQQESSKERMEEQIGTGAKYTYEITEKTEITGSDLEEIKEHLADEYDIPAEDVEQAYSLDFEFTITGSDDEVSSSSSDSKVVCIRGEWYQYPF